MKQVRLIYFALWKRCMYTVLVDIVKISHINISVIGIGA